MFNKMSIELVEIKVQKYHILTAIEKLNSTTIEGLGRGSRDWRLGTGERERD